MLGTDEKAGHAALAMEYVHSLMSHCYGLSFLSHFRSTTDSLAEERGQPPRSAVRSFPIRDQESLSLSAEVHAAAVGLIVSVIFRKWWSFSILSILANMWACKSKSYSQKELLNVRILELIENWSEGENWGYYFWGYNCIVDKNDVCIYLFLRILWHNDSF